MGKRARLSDEDSRHLRPALVQTKGRASLEKAKSSLKRMFTDEDLKSCEMREAMCKPFR